MDSIDSSTQDATNQAKRDISLSYSATDIDSKQGARFKTITVIKNLNKDGSSEKLSINPEHHKNENWANAFRDNFDSYGTIPDVPDIDDLFEFMNKKQKIKPKAKNENKTEKSSSPSPLPSPSPSSSMVIHSRKPLKGRVEDDEKPVVEPTIESFSTDTSKSIIRTGSMQMPTQKPSQLTASATSTMTLSNKSRTDSKTNNSQKSSPTVEKIKGDAELIPSITNGQKRQNANGGSGSSSGARKSSIRSQSMLLNKEKAFERLINVNYSTPQHTVHQYFENYVQENSKGYDYVPPPCTHPPSSSVNVATSSGRSYDIPRTNSAANSNNGNMNPYIAPSVARKPSSTTQTNPPIQINPLQRFPPYNPQQPTYSVNSIVPPLAAGLQSNPNYATPVQTQSIAQQSTTSQRPYVAPNIRSGPGYNRSPPSTTNYGGPAIAPIYRTNVFGINKPNVGRSRGLKY